MQPLITSYLLQNKECILPGIGILQINNLPAITDVAKGEVLPPSEEIIFNEASYTESPGLVKYISDKKQIQQSKAEEVLKAYCKEWKQKIDEGGALTFETFGSLQKNAEGFISFVRHGSRFNFWQPIHVNDPFQKTKNPVFVEEEPVVEDAKVVEEIIVVERSHWLHWAAVLFTTGALLLFFQFKGEKLTGEAVGNKNYFVIEPTMPTYKIPKK